MSEDDHDNLSDESFTFEEAIMEGYPVEHPDYEGAWLYVPAWGYFHSDDRFYAFKNSISINEFTKKPPNTDDHGFWTSKRWKPIDLIHYVLMLEDLSIIASKEDDFISRLDESQTEYVLKHLCRSAVKNLFSGS